MCCSFQKEASPASQIKERPEKFLSLSSKGQVENSHLLRVRAEDSDLSGTLRAMARAFLHFYDNWMQASCKK